MSSVEAFDLGYNDEHPVVDGNVPYKTDDVSLEDGNTPRASDQVGNVSDDPGPLHSIDDRSHTDSNTKLHRDSNINSVDSGTGSSLSGSGSNYDNQLSDPAKLADMIKQRDVSFPDTEQIRKSGREIIRFPTSGSGPIQEESDGQHSEFCLKPAPLKGKTEQTELEEYSSRCNTRSTTANNHPMTTDETTDSTNQPADHTGKPTNNASQPTNQLMAPASFTNKPNNGNYWWIRKIDYKLLLQLFVVFWATCIASLSGTVSDALTICSEVALDVKLIFTLSEMCSWWIIYTSVLLTLFVVILATQSFSDALTLFSRVALVIRLIFTLMKKCSWWIIYTSVLLILFVVFLLTWSFSDALTLFSLVARVIRHIFKLMEKCSTYWRIKQIISTFLGILFVVFWATWCFYDALILFSQGARVILFIFMLREKCKFFLTGNNETIRVSIEQKLQIMFQEIRDFFLNGNNETIREFIQRKRQVMFQEIRENIFVVCGILLVTVVFVVLAVYSERTFDMLLAIVHISRLLMFIWS